MIPKVLCSPESEMKQLLRELDLAGVAVSAQIDADGALSPVAGAIEKLLAAARESALPRIHTVVVAEEQRSDVVRIDPKLAGDDPHATFRVIFARTLAEAARLLSLDAKTRWGQIIDCTTELRDNRDFVGRDWLKELVNSFLRGSRPSGYLLITGEPGAGKSAFLAECIRTEAAPVYHFIKKNRGDWDDPDAFFRSLAAQLSRAWVLQFDSEDSAKNPAKALYHSLEKVSRTLDKGERAILWLDGLDEAYGPASRFSGVALPGPLQARLPDGVFLVLTSRPGEHLNWLADNSLCETIGLEDEGAANQADIRAYMEAQNRKDELELSPEFIATAVERSENNFLFAVRLMEDLRRSAPEERKPDRIPAGLRGWMVKQLEYVVRKWQSLTGQAMSRQARREVVETLGLLACVRESLSLRDLHGFFGGERASRIEDIVAVAADFFVGWKAGRSPDAALRFFHSSFPEFVLEEVADPKELHEQWASVCLGWREQEGGLRRYAWRYLVSHLVAGRMREALVQVLTDFDYMQGKIGADGTPALTVYDLLRDFDAALSVLPESSGKMRVAALQRAVDTNAHILGENPGLFIPQIYATVMHGGDQYELVKEMVEAAAGRYRGTWLKLASRSRKASIPLRTLKGHGASVTSVAFSPDGKAIISGSTDETVRLWDVETGECKRIFEGHTHGVQWLAFSPDGMTITVASNDGLARRWDWRTGERKQIPEKDSAPIKFAGAIATSRDYYCLVWDARAGECRHIRFSLWNVAVKLSPDGATVAGSGINSGEIYLWDARTGECKQILRGNTEGVTSLAFSPDGVSVASGSNDHSMRLFDAHSGKQKWLYWGHASRVTSVSFSADGALAASGASDGTVHLLDARTGERISKRGQLGHAHSVHSVAFSPDSSIIATGSADNTVHLWDARLGNWQQETQPVPVTTVVSFSEDGMKIATGSSDHTVRLCDWRTGIWGATAQRHAYSITSMTFSPDEITVASGSHDKTIRLWDTRTEECRRILQGHADDVISLAFSPDGAALASGSWDRAVRLWDVGNGDLRWSSEDLPAGAVSLAFSPDGATLAGGCWAESVSPWKISKLSEFGHQILGALDKERLWYEIGRVRLWNVETGELKQVLEGHTMTVTSVAFSPDGATLASGSLDGRVRLWDVPTSELKGTLGGYTFPITSVAFSPNGIVIAIGSADRTVRLWNTRTGRQLALFHCQDAVLRIQFTTNGSQIRVADSRGPTHVPVFYLFDIVNPTA